MDAWPSAVSQGALGLECSKDDAEMLEWTEKLACPAATRECAAERALLRGLEGGCQIALG